MRILQWTIFIISSPNKFSTVDSNSDFFDDFLTLIFSSIYSYLIPFLVSLIYFSFIFCHSSSFTATIEYLSPITFFKNLIISSSFFSLSTIQSHVRNFLPFLSNFLFFYFFGLHHLYYSNLLLLSY